MITKGVDALIALDEARVGRLVDCEEARFDGTDHASWEICDEGRPIDRVRNDVVDLLIARNYVEDRSHETELDEPVYAININGRRAMGLTVAERCRRFRAGEREPGDEPILKLTLPAAKLSKLSIVNRPRRCGKTLAIKQVEANHSAEAQLKSLVLAEQSGRAARLNGRPRLYPGLAPSSASHAWYRGFDQMAADLTAHQQVQHPEDPRHV